MRTARTRLTGPSTLPPTRITSPPRPVPARGPREPLERVPRMPMTGARPGVVPMPAQRPMPVPVGRPPIAPARPILSMRRGGKVGKTGLYKLHKGENVVPLSSLRRAKRNM